MEPMDEKSWWVKSSKAYIEDGGLVGSLVIYHAPPEGLVLSLQGLLDFLRNSGIQFGVNTFLCQQIVLSPETYVNERLVVAEGKPAMAGEDARIELQVEENFEKKPRVLENGRVDFFDMGSVMLVKAGDILAVRVPPTDGVDGMGVNGQVIPGKKGRDYRLPQGRNTLAEQDGCVLVAEAEGHVVYSAKENKIHVFKEFVVEKDVDFSVGNIEFPGSIRVQGNVQPGFKLRAEGDIEIQGYADAAWIEAGGSIVIRGGVQGRNKGIIRAGGNLRTPFIQNATVDVGGTCFVGESVMHSQVSAGSKVVMEGRRAVIVGGMIRAGEEISTRVLGSPMAAPTEVEVGVHPHLRAEIHALQESLKELHKNIDKTQKAIALLDNMAGAAGALPPDKAALLQKLTLTYEHFKVDEEELLMRRAEIEVVLQDVKSARVIVHETVYPGVKVTISNYVFYVRDSFSHVAFAIKDAEVHPAPL